VNAPTAMTATTSHVCLFMIVILSSPGP
jgi:hypothetical protein